MCAVLYQDGANQQPAKLNIAAPVETHSSTGRNRSQSRTVKPV